MFKGLFWLSVAIFNVYLAEFLQNPQQRSFQLVIALFCGALSIVYFYSASRPK